MTKTDEHLKPISVNKETWMYAEKRGLCIVRQICDPSGKLIQADMYRVPWSKIERAVSIRPVARKPRNKGRRS